eukprot:220283-Chlamydomonas_euryale.AAC.1
MHPTQPCCRWAPPDKWAPPNKHRAKASYSTGWPRTFQRLAVVSKAVLYRRHVLPEPAVTAAKPQTRCTVSSRLHSRQQVARSAEGCAVSSRLRGRQQVAQSAAGCTVGSRLHSQQQVAQSAAGWCRHWARVRGEHCGLVQTCGTIVREINGGLVQALGPGMWSTAVPPPPHQQSGC